MQVLTFSELSKRWKISRRSIERGVKRGEFPQPMRIGGSLRFSLHAIEEFERRQSGDVPEADAAADALDQALAACGDRLAAMDSPPGSAPWMGDAAARYRDLLGRLESLDEAGVDELVAIAREHGVDSDRLELHLIATRMYNTAEPVAGELEKRQAAVNKLSGGHHLIGGAVDERVLLEQSEARNAVSAAKDAVRIVAYVQAAFPELFDAAPTTILEPRLGLISPLLNRAAELGLRDELVASLQGETSDDEPEVDTGPATPWWLNRKAPDTADKPTTSQERALTL